MPLVATNLDQAAQAYAALEQRTNAAEQRVGALQQTVGQLQTTNIGHVTQIHVLNQHILDLESRNIQLQTQVQQVAQATSDMQVSEFAQTVAVSVEITEAVMPDRAISSVSTELRSYLLAHQGSLGIRLPQPEFVMQPGELSSTSIQMTKVPPPSGSNVSSKSLYSVLIEKQALYASARWSASKAAAALVSGIIGILAGTGDWGGIAVPQAASAVATLELAFAEELASAAPAGLSQYRSLATNCQTLARGIVARAKLLPGDVRALSTALDQTTTLAQGWLA